MDNTNGVSTGKKGKKELRRTIAAKLEASLEEFRAGLKEKKFKAAVKRASKLLANDLFVRTKKGKAKAENSLTVVEEEIGA
jgi:hypothetical protein